MLLAEIASGLLGALVLVIVPLGLAFVVVEGLYRWRRHG